MMKKLMKWMSTNYTKKSWNNCEQGQALVLVLVLLMVGILIITSSLAFMGTSLKNNKVYVANTTALYSAEAGIQDGIWNMLNTSSDDLADPSSGLLKASSSLSSPQLAYSDYDFNTDGWMYSLSNSINTYPVDITLTNAWVPMVDDNDTTGWIASTAHPLPPDGVITHPPLTEANNIINDTDLSITGGTTTPGVYKITINYSTPSTPLTIISIGCWLPQGFTYNNSSSNLKDKTTANWLYSTEQVLPCAGNQAAVWTFPSGTTFSSLFSHMPGQTGTGSTIVITFAYAYSNPSKPYPDALSWMTNTANGIFPYTYTWDGAVRVSDMISTAGNTEIEAYIPQSSTRALGLAIAGDYVAIGNSLMTMGAGYNPSNDTNGIRHSAVTYPNTSSATVSADTNKAGSIVEAAYLYWSGWLNSSSHALGSSYGTRVNLFINTHQVCFDTDGKSYKRGTSAISILPTAAQTQVNGGTGSDYSYSCYKDVTALVKGELLAEPASIFSNDITFGLGPASGCALGDTGNEWSYAGWSLVIIYSGPTTLGHQLYLYDKFTYAPSQGQTGYPTHGSDIDPTQNTAGPGGFITGFIVPQRSPDETDSDNAATLTAFVGEGDWCYSGDFIALNAPSSYWTNPWSIPTNSPYRLWDGINNSSIGETPASPNNVWNSYPQSGTGLVDGVDIKTFSITWGSGLIHAGDTYARIDMPTGVDSWNLVYIILSFRSSVTSGGSVSYLIRRKGTP